MRMAYLILAHEDEAQLALLVEALLPPDSDDLVVIHADRASPLWSALRARLPGPAERVHLIADPVAVRWGHWSQVAAISRLVRQAVGSGCDYAHLISGADWPVASRERMVAEIRRDTCGGESQCYIETAPGHLEQRMQTTRLDTRWLRLDPARDRAAYAATWELRRIARWIDAARERTGLVRSRPLGTWHYGATWWSLPADALRVLDREMRDLLASGRLRGTVCADEHVAPTILAHHFADRIAGNRRFVEFPEGASSPRLLDATDWPRIAESRAWFARKVSARHDPFFLSPARDMLLEERPMPFVDKMAPDLTS